MNTFFCVWELVWNLLQVVRLTTTARYYRELRTSIRAGQRVLTAIPLCASTGSRLGIRSIFLFIDSACSSSTYLPIRRVFLRPHFLFLYDLIPANVRLSLFTLSTMRCFLTIACS